MNIFWNQKDSLLDGFTYEDIITALQCNYPKDKINKQTVKKQVNDILKIQLQDMHALLDIYTDEIIKLSK